MTAIIGLTLADAFLSTVSRVGRFMLKGPVLILPQATVYRHFLI